MPFLDLEETLADLLHTGVQSVNTTTVTASEFTEGFQVVWGPDKQLEYYHSVLKHDPVYRFKRSVYFKSYRETHKEELKAKRKPVKFKGRTPEQKARVNELKRQKRKAHKLRQHDELIERILSAKGSTEATCVPHTGGDECLKELENSR